MQLFLLASISVKVSVWVLASLEPCEEGSPSGDGSVLVCPCMREWTVSSHSSAGTSYSCLSLSLFPPLHLCVPLPLPLSPVHLSLLDSSHYCPGTSSACPAKARHGNGIWERRSAWEIVNEESEEDADREREREKMRESWKKGNQACRKGNKTKGAAVESNGCWSIIKSSVTELRPEGQ